MLSSTEAVLRQRVATQHLMDPLPTATAVVRDLLCVQAQEYAHAFWSLGLRSKDQTLRQVRSQFDSGAFVRTHILRPTWHYVAATDIAAVLKLTSPRVQRRNAGRYRDLGLDVDTLARSAELVMDLLRGGQFRTRAQIGAHLSQYGLAATGPRLAYMVMNAELDGLICSGPMAGAQHTYALLEERAPRWSPVAREELLTEVVFRFFAGHGPATSSDLVRWSSLSALDVAAGLAANRTRLESRVVADQTVWWDPARELAPLPSRPRAFLLPLYDELVLSYPMIRFPAALDHPQRAEVDRFVGSVILDEVDVGSWRRTVRGSTVQVETRLSPSLTGRDRAAIAEVVARLAAFLELQLGVLGEESGKPWIG